MQLLLKEKCNPKGVPFFRNKNEESAIAFEKKIPKGVPFFMKKMKKSAIQRVYHFLETKMKKVKLLLRKIPKGVPFL